MAWFERGREKDNLVEVDETIDQFRYALDPSTLQNDLYHLAAEANMEGYHLWDSSARLQLCSTATWMATTRQITGNTLVGYAERASGNGKIPKDVASFAQTNYTEAQKWLAYRQDTYTDTQPQTLPDRFDVEISAPPSHMASQQLMTALKSTTEQILFIEYPIVETIADGSLRKPVFDQFRHYIAYERDQLQLKFTEFNRVWNNDLSLAEPQGQVQYDELVRFYNQAIGLGVTSLIPGFSDERYKLILKHRPQPKQATPPSAAPHLPFNPDAIGPLPGPFKPERPSKPFSPPDLSPRRPFTAPEINAPQPKTAAKPFIVPEIESPQQSTPPAKKPFDPSAFLEMDSPKPEVTSKPIDPSLF